MKKVVPKLRQEVKVKVDIVTSDDIKIYHTVKFQDFTARYIIIALNTMVRLHAPTCVSSGIRDRNLSSRAPWRGKRLKCWYVKMLKINVIVIGK